MLTARIPDSWQDLQKEVGRILAECGFAVHVEHPLALVRGRADIDVYAEETIKGRRNIILCECKYWKAAVPQAVVHSFRTVTADAGANAGYIISMNGFQVGARQATQNTNIRLVTWAEFQVEFEPTWLAAYFEPTITNKLDPLLSYSEPFAPAWFDELSEDCKAAYMQAHEKWSPLGYLAMSMSRWARLSRGRPLPALPLRATDEQASAGSLPDEILDALGYGDLLDAILEHGLAAITEFRGIRAKVRPPIED